MIGVMGLSEIRGQSVSVTKSDRLDDAQFFSIIEHSFQEPSIQSGIKKLGNSITVCSYSDQQKQMVIKLLSGLCILQRAQINEEWPKKKSDFTYRINLCLRALEGKLIPGALKSSLSLEDQEALRFEIAKLFAKIDPKKIIQNIDRFQIQDEKSRFEIAKLCVDATESFSVYNSFNLSERSEIEMYLLYCMDGLAGLCVRGEDFTECMEALDNCAFNWIEFFFNEIKNPLLQRQFLNCSVPILWALRKRFNNEELRWLNDQNLIQSIYELKLPHLYIPFVYRLIQFGGIPDFRSKFDLINPKMSPLFRMLIVQLKELVLDQELIDGFLEVLDSSKDWKDKNRTCLIINVLCNIIHTNDLSVEEKVVCFKHILSIRRKHGFRSMLLSLRYLDFLIDLKAMEELRYLNVEDIKSIVGRALRKLLCFPSTQGIEDRFDQIFSGRCRQAIIQYIGRIRRTKDPELIDSLNHFINSVLDGSFIKKRYSVDSSHSHLQELEQIQPGILGQWKIPTIFSGKGVQITDTDDPLQLLLCGIGGSCQRVDGNPENNKALLGYLWHGQTRLLGIFDKQDGTLQARSMLRLLINEQNQPILFLEKYYGPEDERRPEYEKQILHLAKEKAKAMNLRLAWSPSFTSPVYTEIFHSLGGPAPFEYSDAGEGANKVYKNGIFTILGTYLNNEGL